MKIVNVKTDTKTIYDILCIGAGATGSHFISFLAQLLANNDEHSLTIVDQDIIEDKNLINQKFLKRDVGKAKAEVLAERYGKVYPNIDVCYRTQYVKKENQLIDMIENRPNVKDNSIPIIIGCVDNNPSRVIMSNVFNKMYMPMAYIDAGNGDEARVGQVVIAIKALEKISTHYYREVIKKSEPVADVFEEIRNDKTDINKILSCTYVSESKPQNIGSNIMSATALYTIINNLISFDDIPCTRVTFDAEKGNIVSRTVLIKEKGKKDEKKKIS